jgi:hypothetical protein
MAATIPPKEVMPSTPAVAITAAVAVATLPIPMTPATPVQTGRRGKGYTPRIRAAR